MLPLTSTTGFSGVMEIVGVGTRCKAWLVLAWQPEQVFLTLNDGTTIFSDY